MYCGCIKVLIPWCSSKGIRQKENCRAISHIWCGSQTHNNPSAIRTQLANILAILRPTTLWQEVFQILSTKYESFLPQETIHIQRVPALRGFWDLKKNCFTPPLTCPQGCQGCQKIWTNKLKSTLP